MAEDDDSQTGAPAPPPPGEPQAEERLAALEVELAETRDKLLRALAETENVRRRGQREREDAQRYSLQNFAKDMLSVADNLRRALGSVPEGAENGPASGLLAGVAATERELLAALERHGVRKVEPQPGDRFDHNLHEAMFEVESPGQPAGTIVQVLQPGYVIHDRLLRPAMVGVAKASGEPRPRVDEVV